MFESATRVRERSFAIWAQDDTHSACLNLQEMLRLKIIKIKKGVFDNSLAITNFVLKIITMFCLKNYNKICLESYKPIILLTREAITLAETKRTSPIIATKISFFALSIFCGLPPDIIKRTPAITHIKGKIAIPNQKIKLKTASTTSSKVEFSPAPQTVMLLGLTHDPLSMPSPGIASPWHSSSASQVPNSGLVHLSTPEMQSQRTHGMAKTVCAQKKEKTTKNVINKYLIFIVIIRCNC